MLQIVTGTGGLSIRDNVCATTAKQNENVERQVHLEHTHITDMLSSDGVESTMATSVRSRSAAKTTKLDASTSLLQPSSLEQRLTGTNPNSKLSAEKNREEISGKDVECSCGTESVNTCQPLLRLYTPELITQSEKQHLNSAKSRPPLGPIKVSKYSLETGSVASQGKKVISPKLPRAQANLRYTSPPGGVVPKAFGILKSNEKSNTSKSGTSRSRLSLKPRSNRAHSLGNSEQGLSLLSHNPDSPGSSPSMKRSNSLSHRPDWVT